MSRKIYTYTDLQALGSCSFWNEIKQYPQICVSADMRKSLKGTQEYDNIDGIFKEDKFVLVKEFRQLMEAILPKWTDDETKFHEMVVLAQFIREQIAKYGDDPSIRHWLVGCRRNLNMILSAIILLEEANIGYDDLRALNDRNVQLLIDAWKYLRKNDSAIDNFRKNMVVLEKRDTWNSVFNKVYGRTNFHTFVFHGFYYFTPIQERVMCALEKAGYKLIFLIPYNEKYPYANEIWRKTYSVQNGYPDISNWIMDKNSKHEPYGEIFEGRKCKIDNKLKIKEYASVMEFVHEMKHVKEQGYFVYSSNPNTANQILKDFYPDEYGERKLLSYPIGQFISTLNKMWDEDLQDIVLDEDRLIECFASGWLAHNGVSGKQYMQDLVYIMPFFKDCTTIKMWEERLDLLKQIEYDVVEPFRQNLDVDDRIARWQEIMGNPFLNFSVFAVSHEKLDIIVKLIKQLLAMAKELFGADKTIRVQDHIRKLDSILKSREMSSELYDEEIELVKDMFTKLSDTSDFSMECFPADISSALNLFMSGHFNDGEIQSNSAGMVSPLYKIDAACVKQKGKVHVCLCDINNMPGGRKEYVWPLTSRHIKECYSRTKNPYIVNLMHIMEATYICNRYFMYAALKNKDVQLSWIREMDDKLLAPSPYIKLVCEAANIELKPAKRNSVTHNQVQELPVGRSRTLPYDLKKMPMNVSKEAKMDYAICPMKYAFGYVVEKYPTFQGEFHQNYAINGLIASIYNLMKTKGMSVDYTYRNIMKLFPEMRNVEKRQIYDYLHYQNNFNDEDITGMSELGDMKYTEERLRVRFPNKDVRDQAIVKYGNLYTPDGQKGMDFYETAADEETSPFKKKRTDVCLFCQHQNYCRYAVFAVDEEGLYD